MSTLDALVYESASVRPHDVAVLYDNGSDTSTLTYGQLGATARSVSTKYRTSIIVAPYYKLWWLVKC